MGWWEQSWYALGALLLGLVLGRLWHVFRPEPPRENPWVTRACRDWLERERWTI
jgi:hypothetical protein